VSEVRSNGVPLSCSLLLPPVLLFSSPGRVYIYGIPPLGATAVASTATRTAKCGELLLCTAAKKLDSSLYSAAVGYHRSRPPASCAESPAHVLVSVPTVRQHKMISKLSQNKGSNKNYLIIRNGGNLKSNLFGNFGAVLLLALSRRGFFRPTSHWQNTYSLASLPLLALNSSSLRYPSLRVPGPVSRRQY
jgi:hypothetical protein